MKQKNIKTKIKEYFLEHPSQRLRVRQIERELNLPLPSVIRYTKELMEENILKIQNISGINFFKAKTESENYTLAKKLHNLQRIYDSGMVKLLKNKLHNPCIILFGSFAKGTDNEESDIDIFIETKGTVPALNRFERVLGKQIQVISKDRLGKIPNKHLANNIVNGITLNGYLEVF